MKKLLKKNDGFVLIWVLIVFMFVVVLVATVASLLPIVTESTLFQRNSQQAYLTAKSAASTVATYIIKNTSNQAAIEQLINNSGSGSTSTMGNYNVKVEYVDDTKIKVTSTATYSNVTEKVVVYLKKSAVTSGFSATTPAIFVNGTAVTGIGQSTVNGNIYINGPVSLSAGTSVNGTLYVNGDTSISGAASSTKGLVCFGNVTLANSGAINGDVLTKGTVSMSGAPVIAGKMTSDNSLTNSGGTINGNAIVGNNVSFSGGGVKVQGTLSYLNTLNLNGGSLATYVPHGATKLSGYTPLDLSSYIPAPLPSIPVPTIAQNPQLYNTVVISNNTISNSGTITTAVASSINSLPYGTILKINAATNDISLLLNNTALSPGNGLSIEVLGTHNVFLYMKGTASIAVGANEYFGNTVRGTNPRLFIIGDGTQAITLSSNSELDAIVYIPNGSMTASGSALTSYKFIGCCIVKSVNLSSGVSFQYSTPAIGGTPLAVLQTPSSGGSWTIESWADN